MLSSVDVQADAEEVSSLCELIEELVPYGGATEHLKNDLLQEAPKLRSSIFKEIRQIYTDSECDLHLVKSWGVLVPPQVSEAQWHDHRYAHLSFTFYLKMPENAAPLLFRVGHQIYDVHPKEGQLLIFPSSWMHQVGANEIPLPRFSLSGDLLFTAKPGKKLIHQLPDPSNWVVVE